MYMNKNKNQGFTLIELLVVISIIAFISTGIVSLFHEARATSRDARRIADFKNITTALELFHTKYNMYPCGSAITVSKNTQTDGDWLHNNTPTDSFLDAVAIGGPICNTDPKFGIVTDGLVRYGIRDPLESNTTSYIYEVTNDRQNYILYGILEAETNKSKMLNDGGFINCFYEVGPGVGTIHPYWLCQ